MKKHKYEDLYVGQKATDTKVITLENVLKFSQLTGDYNPVHVDREYASKTIFKDIIAHGPYIMTIITTLFANELPGEGSVYLYQDSKFIKPVYINDIITAVIEITSLMPEKRIVVLDTRCVNQNGEDVIIGTAKIKLL